jgi:CPA1 family monovalent cation:H+ antiporter
MTEARAQPQDDPPDEQRDRPLGLFRRLLRGSQPPRSAVECVHLTGAGTDAEPTTAGCAEHRPDDGPPVHLRLCLTCGHVGCCDSSRPRHATAHYEQTGHPVMRSFEPGETWRWCYLDELLG